MLPRTQALLISLALIIGLGGWFAAQPGAFASFSPGPTLNILGKEDPGTAKSPAILSVTGHQEYRDKGALRLVTIRPSQPDDRIGLIRAIAGWIEPDVDIYPYDSIYAPTDTDESNRKESAAQMTSSKDAAVAAALGQLGIEYDTSVSVVGVDKAGPSKGHLRKGDRVVSVDGHQTPTSEQLVKAIQAKSPGTQVNIGVRRGDRTLTETLTTAPLGAAGTEAKQSRIGIGISQGFDFPFTVKVRLDDNIGGPSAGMMFALSIIDVLTPGSLTGGKSIAGTGEIDPEGKVGSIGGIRQKIAGAQHDKVELFLVPAENCDEAVHANYDPDKMRLARVATLKEAVSVIKTWVANPGATLPSCR